MRMTLLTPPAMTALPFDEHRPTTGQPLASAAPARSMRQSAGFSTRQVVAKISLRGLLPVTSRRRVGTAACLLGLPAGARLGRARWPRPHRNRGAPDSPPPRSPAPEAPSARPPSATAWRPGCARTSPGPDPSRPSCLRRDFQNGWSASPACTSPRASSDAATSRSPLPASRSATTSSSGAVRATSPSAWASSVSACPSPRDAPASSTTRESASAFPPAASSTMLPTPGTSTDSSRATALSRPYTSPVAA